MILGIADVANMEKINPSVCIASREYHYDQCLQCGCSLNFMKPWVLQILLIHGKSQSLTMHSEKKLVCTGCTLLAHYDEHSQITHVVSSLCTACILECTREHKLETTCVIYM